MNEQTTAQPTTPGTNEHDERIAITRSNNAVEEARIARSNPVTVIILNAIWSGTLITVVYILVYGLRRLG